MIAAPQSLIGGVPAFRLAPRPAAADPVVVLYQQYVALENAQKPISAQEGELRAGFVERYGERRLDYSVIPQWETDQSYDELRRLVQECDEFTTRITAVIVTMIDTPATTMAGALAKLHVGNDMWADTRRGNCSGIMEDIARAAMADAQRVLEEAGV
jgi:hypothetical protein